MVDEFAPKRRPLPEDETELERVLRKYRILAKPCVGGISSTLEVLGSSPLDKDEKEGGEFSIAAMLYEFGAEMDSRVLFALWTVGIAGPRLAEAALKKKSLEKQVANATPPKPV